MKKLFAVVLAVAMMATMGFSAFAAESVNLIPADKVASNDAKATVTANADGSITVTTTEAWGGTGNDIAYGAAIELFITNIDVTKTPYIHLDIDADVPFRITQLDRNDDEDKSDTKWISYGQEFFNTIIPAGGEDPGTTYEGNFFPAGDYQCSAFLQGYYNWKHDNEGLANYDPTQANIIALYVELKEVGSITINQMNLSDSETFVALEGETTPTVDPNGDGDNTNNGGSTPNPSTGDNTNAIVFAVVAALAAGVVTLSVVSKKVRAR